jgi:hypothetical protein
MKLLSSIVGKNEMIPLLSVVPVMSLVQWAGSDDESVVAVVCFGMHVSCEFSMKIVVLDVYS